MDPTPVPADYDSDPDRWRTLDRSWNVFGDVHEPVAARIVADGLEPVLDIGGGDGRLRHVMPEGWPLVLLDRSPAQLSAAVGPKVDADAMRLPIADGSVGAVAMLWMLYHLDQPVDAIAEARRVLRPGGLLAACTASRDCDPELIAGYPASPFDAEEAEDIVRSVFDDVHVVRWDAPMTYLPDHDAVVRYCRSHLIPPSTADGVDPPLWLTKRGCLVFARG